MQAALDSPEIEAAKQAHGVLRLVKSKEINPWEHLNYFTPKTSSRLMTEHEFLALVSPSEEREEVSRFVKRAAGVLKKNLPFRIARQLATKWTRTHMYWRLERPSL